MTNTDISAMTDREAQADEREALRSLVRHIYREHGMLIPAHTLADLVFARGYRKHPGPEITDEMVERALNGWMNLSDADAGMSDWQKWRTRNEGYMRAALETAMGKGRE